MSVPLLEIKGVRKQFGGLSALRRAWSMHVNEGEILSVIGPNGAGKSTLFNVITGLYAPDDGDITFRGESIVGLRPNQVAKLGIARTLQNVHLFPNMTVLENAMVGQHCRSKSGIFGSVLRLPSTEARGATGSASVRGSAGVLRDPALRIPPGQPAMVALVRKPRRLEIAARWPPSPRSCCSTSRPPG